jgi:hypothetical protein
MYILLNETIRTDEDIKMFLRGTVVLLFLLLLVGSIQAIYLYTNQLEGVVKFFGNFEWRFWSRPNWYHKGSYVQTLRRINGFMPEASYYASQIGIFGMPVMYSLIKNKVTLFGESIVGNRLFYIVLLILSFLINVLAQTSTGLLLVAFSLVVIFVDIIRSQSRVIVLVFATFAAVFVVGLTFSYLSVPIVYNFLNEWVFGKESPNRLGSTIAYLNVFLSHPFLGVQAVGYFALPLVPIDTTANREFIQDFLPNRQIQNLSVIFSWLGQYGLVIILPIFAFIISKIAGLFQLQKKIALDEIHSFDSELVPVIKNMFLYFTLNFLVASFFIFDALNIMFVLMFVFFVVTYNRLVKLYQEEMQLADEVQPLKKRKEAVDAKTTPILGGETRLSRRKKK